MSRHLIWIALVAATVSLSGCSGDKAAPATSAAKSSSQSSSQESSSSSAPSDEAVAPLDSESCTAVTGASLDLSAATSKEEARTAADKLETYGPTESAKSAIEHFADTGGLQIDDPDMNKYNDDLDAWVHQVCPPA